MPDAAVAEVETPAAAKEHWATKAKRERDEAAAKATTTEPTITPSAPIEAPPVSVSTAVAVPAPILNRHKVLSPDEFIIPFLTNDPQGVRAFQGQPNVEAAMASSALTAYCSYLLLAAPKYNAHYKATHPDARFVPGPGALWAEYDAAMKE